MKTLVEVVGAILIIQGLAFPQIVRGTVAVVYYTSGKLIIAADSRAQLDGGDATVHEDNECKVAALGDKIVFVAAGFTGYDRNGPADKLATWRASGEAHEAFSDVLTQLQNKANKSLVALIAARWGERVRSHIADLYAIRPKAITDSLFEGLLTTALFSGADADGHLTVLIVQLRLGTGGIEVVGPKEVAANGCPPCSLGRGSILFEFFNKTTERARDEAARWEIRKRQLSTTEFDRLWTIRFVDLTILLYPDPREVGGFIDALELTPKGVTWIQRKDSCPEN